jgi:hypothetical protein
MHLCPSATDTMLSFSIYFFVSIAVLLLVKVGLVDEKRFWWVILL